MKLPVETIPTTPGTKIVVNAPVSKLCPVKHETDDGEVFIHYTTAGQAPELHALADYLRTFSSVAISHEAFTERLADEFRARVVSVWHTAGMNVTCERSHRVLR